MWQHYRNNIAGFNFVIGFHGYLVNTYAFSLGCSLNFRTGNPFQLLKQKFVDAQHTLAFIGHNAMVFVKLSAF
jgi:hypothetical protein